LKKLISGKIVIALNNYDQSNIKSSYMSNNAQEDINKLTNKARIRYLDLSNRELVGEMNLTTQFTILVRFSKFFELLYFASCLEKERE
jgi:hypothetical protein